MNRQLTFITLVFFLTASAWASEPAVYTGLLSNTGAGGYDTVSYFETGKPAKGSREYTTERLGGCPRLPRQRRPSTLGHPRWPAVSQLQ